jgi:acetyl-CoA synthetase
MGSREFLEARDFLLGAENYQQAKDGFAWPKPHEFNWATDYFDTLAERCTNPALVYIDDDGSVERVTFQRLRERSSKVASFLRSTGLRKGERVMLMMQNRVELFESFLGAMKAGCVIIPASTLLTPDDIADRIARGKVRCMIADSELTEKVDASTSSTKGEVLKVSVRGQRRGWIEYGDVDSHSPDFRPEQEFSLQDELLIYFTSGTTAKPKLVSHTHGSYPIGHLTTMYWIGLKKGDRHYNVSAPGWAKHAWSTIFAVWNAEGTSFVYNYTGRFDPKKVLKLIEEHEINTLCAPPTVWRFLLLEDMRKYKFSLKQVVSAGEPLNPEIIQKVKSTTGLTIREGYGQTETTLQIGTFPGMEVRPGSMGVEAPGFTIDVVDDSYSPAPPETEGAIAIRVKPERPLGLMTGYIDMPQRNLEVFVGDWYLTGDVAYRDKDGCYWFIGRSDDVFKSSDYRISPFELESELMVHPAVTEVAVVRSPDQLRGFVPKAFLLLKPRSVPSQDLALSIFKFTREEIAPYRRPRIIQFMSELPKTISGKIKRAELREYESKLRASKARAENEYFESDFSSELGVRRK